MAPTCTYLTYAASRMQFSTLVISSYCKEVFKGLSLKSAINRSKISEFKSIFRHRIFLFDNGINLGLFEASFPRTIFVICKTLSFMTSSTIVWASLIWLRYTPHNVKQLKLFVNKYKTKF